MPCPKVSVVIPTYNRAKLVCEAIDSVLAQTFRDYEIIVVDDGSTDATGELLKVRYGESIRYMRQENRGPAAARNRGVNEARGEYAAFLDSDDLWVPSKLADCWEAISDAGERGAGAPVDIVVHRCFRDTREGLVPVTQAQEEAMVEWREAPCLRNALAVPGSWQLQGSVIRTGFFRAKGGLKEYLRVAEDYEFFARAWIGASVVVMDKGLTVYRRVDRGCEQTDETAYQSRIRARHDIMRLGYYPEPILRRGLAVDYECLGGLMRTSRKWTEAAKEYGRAWRLLHSPRLLGKFLVTSAFSILVGLFAGRDR